MKEAPFSGDGSLKQSSDLVSPSTLQDAWETLAVACALGAHVDIVPGMTVWLVLHHSGARPRPHVTVIGVYATRTEGVRALRNYLARLWTNDLNSRMSALREVNVNSDDDERIIREYFRLNNSQRYEITEIVLTGRLAPVYQWEHGT